MEGTLVMATFSGAADGMGSVTKDGTTEGRAAASRDGTIVVGSPSFLKVGSRVGVISISGVVGSAVGSLVTVMGAVVGVLSACWPKATEACQRRAPTKHSGSEIRFLKGREWMRRIVMLAHPSPYKRLWIY